MIKKNTPYPATAYIKGYLNTIEKTSHQSDLGIKVFLRIFSKNGLSKVFQSIENETETILKPNAKMVWLGNTPELVHEAFLSKKGNKIETWKLVIENKNNRDEIVVGKEEGKWLERIISELSPIPEKKEMTFAAFEEYYGEAGFGDFERFLVSKTWSSLLEYGLVLV